MTELGTLRRVKSFAPGINGRGQVIGPSRASAPDAPHAVVWQNGTMTGSPPSRRQRTARPPISTTTARSSAGPPPRAARHTPSSGRSAAADRSVVRGSWISGGADALRRPLPVALWVEGSLIAGCCSLDGSPYRLTVADRAGVGCRLTSSAGSGRRRVGFTDPRVRMERTFMGTSASAIRSSATSGLSSPSRLSVAARGKRRSRYPLGRRS